MSRLVLIEQYEAMGGPEVGGRGNDGFEEGPTDSGEYRIAYCKRHVSRRYPFWSSVPWGADLKEEAGEIWVKVRNTWERLSRYSPATKEDIAERHKELYRIRALPSSWVFNDFGHMTCYLYKDRNRNGKLDGQETIHGEFLHTTPETEAAHKMGERVRLEPSHGCVHLKPADIDDPRVYGEEPQSHRP